MRRVVALAGVVLATAAASPDFPDERSRPLGASDAVLRPAADTRAGRSTYRDMVEREARAQKLPFEIADAVVSIESGYRPDAIGDVGEVGLMQVRPATAAMLG